MMAVLVSDSVYYYYSVGNVVSGMLENVVSVTERRDNLIKHFTKYVDDEEQLRKEDEQQTEKETTEKSAVH